MKKAIVDGVLWATVDQGDGPPVLLVHGFPLDHTMWQEQIRALAGRYRVIAPDLRGFGQSGVTEGTVTMAQLADELAALLDALGIDRPVCFCGLSMGGYVAWQFVRRHRDRLAALILCDTRAGADTPEAAAGRRETAQQVLASGPAGLAETMIPKLFAPPTAGAHPERIEAIRRVILGTDPRGIAAALQGMAQRPDCTELLGQIDCPVLVLVGQHDTISTPDQMRAVAEAIPDARLAVVPDAGHMAPLENPEEVNRQIGQFLDQLPLAGE